MALRFTDSFDGYSSTGSTDLGIRWEASTNYGYTSTGGKFGGGALFIDNAGASSLRRVMVPLSEEVANNTIAFGFWFFADDTPNFTHNDFMLLNSSNNSTSTSFSAGIDINTDGTISFRKYGTTTNAVTGSINICDGQWHFLEFRYKVGTSTGIAQLYVDGILDINLNPGDTRDDVQGDEILSRFRFNSYQSNPANIYIDDFFFYDDATGTLAGDFDADTDYPIGPLKIEYVLPNSTGTLADFTASSTNDNYTHVDETVPNDDTDYVESGTAGDVDSYGYASLTSTNVVNVLGVALAVQVKNSGQDDIYLRGVTVSSASSAASASLLVPTAYETNHYAIPYDPATSTRWTTAALDAAEFGIEVTTST